MMLCLDVGNSHTFGGIFEGEYLKFKFRYATNINHTSDELGVFLKNVLHQNNLAAEKIKHIAICSVVPSINYSLRAACIKYFDNDAFFLQANVKTGLTIHYRNPMELGMDRIANSIAAINSYPDENIIVIDFGTATTYCAITKNKDYLGGVILAGMKLSMNALQTNTAKLFPVEIIKPASVIGRTTAENIQSGLYYGQLGVLREITQRMTSEYFPDKNPVIIGTGGFSYLFEQEGIFTAIMPDLILQGLRLAFMMNR